MTHNTLGTEGDKPFLIDNTQTKEETDRNGQNFASGSSNINEIHESNDFSDARITTIDCLICTSPEEWHVLRGSVTKMTFLNVHNYSKREGKEDKRSL